MTTMAIYAIAKDESKNVEQFMANFKDAGVPVYVLDTGSSDDTVARLMDLGAIVNESRLPVFDFASARNEALSYVPADIDIVMSVDMDETIEPGFVGKAFEAFSDPEVCAADIDFIFSRDQAGEIAMSYRRVLLHRRTNGHWKYPCHEVLEVEGKIANTSIVGEHRPDQDKARNYLPLLELGVKQFPDDPRVHHYLGREYMYQQQYGMAINVLEKTLGLCQQDSSYVFDTFIYIADCYRYLNEFEGAEHNYRQAIAFDGDRRDGLMYLSQYYYECKMYEEALGMAIRALRIHNKPKHAIYFEQTSYRQWPYHMAAVCYNAIGAKAQAKQYIEWALEAAPRDGYVMADYANITGQIPPGIKV